MTTLDVAFVATAALALVAGLLAVTSRYVVHAALWLVAALLGVAGSLLVLGAELVSLVLVLVYVGAVVILVLFALMVTRAPIGPDVRHAAGPWRLVLAAGAGGAVTALLLAVLLPLAGPWPGAEVTVAATDTTEVAGALFATWVWPLEAVSVLLLVSLITALAVSRLPSSRETAR